MGTLMLWFVRRKYYVDEGIPCNVVGQRIPSSVTKPTVVVTREIFSSVVSGYVYHKSGKECWRDHHGKPNPISGVGGNDWLRKYGSKWVKAVTRVSYPPVATGTDLCTMLASVNEGTGIAIYAEFAYEVYIKPAVELKKKQKQVHLENAHGNDASVLFLCYKDFMSNASFVKSIERIDNFYSLPPRHVDPPGHYKGPHASHVDAAQTIHFNKLARHADALYLGSKLADANSALGC